MEEFDLITKDIINDKSFINLKNESHHGTTRYDHLLRVARVVFRWCKKFNVRDYVSITRASLLHDLFLDKDIDNISELINHGDIAAQNALALFDISKYEEDMIKNHMFPLTLTLPKGEGSYILIAADKLVALYEVFRYMLPKIVK